MARELEVKFPNTVHGFTVGTTAFDATNGTTSKLAQRLLLGREAAVLGRDGLLC